MGDNSAPKSAHFPLRFWHSFADLAHSADADKGQQKAQQTKDKFILYSMDSPLEERFRREGANTNWMISRHQPKFGPADAFSSPDLSADHFPSSTLRLVHKWLAELAGRKEAEGREIRAQLCRMAIGHLERAEADIGQAERRQEAQGQGERARELRRKIRDRTDRAMAEAYVELLMGGGEKRSGRIRKGMVRREEEEKKGRRRRRRKRRQRKVEEKEERRKTNGDPEGKKDERGGREGREERGESMEEGIGEREEEEEGGRRRREGKGKESREGAGKGRAKGVVQPRTNNTLGAMFNDTLPLLIATGRSASESKGMMERERQGGREKETEGMRSEGQRVEDEKTEMKKLKEYSSRREPGNEGKGETGKRVSWKEEDQHQQQRRRAARRRRLKEEEEKMEKTLFPEEVKSSANVCPYCEEQNPLFRHHDFLLHHFANDCIWLCRCDFCDKLVEIHRLNEHQLVRCPFVGETLAECQMCGIARYPDEPNGHPKCRSAHPPPGGAWCPLCLALVRNAESRAEWVRHLTSECRNNFRRIVGNPRKDNDRHSELMAHLEQALARLSVDSPADGNYSLHPRPRFAPQSKTGETAAKGPLGGRRGQMDAQQLKAAVRRLNHERRVKAMQRNIGRMGGRKEERGEGESSDSNKSEE